MNGKRRLPSGNVLILLRLACNSLHSQCNSELTFNFFLALLLDLFLAFSSSYLFIYEGFHL